MQPRSDANGCDNQNQKERKYMMLAEAYGNLHIGLAFGGAAIGIGIAAAGGVVAMSRNPGLAGKILTFMFIGMALAEGMAILAWIVIPTK
ncbi:MAG TPA: ATP synthase F0 subunit C [Verrucomicrobiae bacterium]|nr:ATP synthase F0 subunit C [Verrucomicrobiae bacterium]